MKKLFKRVLMVTFSTIVPLAIFDILIYCTGLKISDLDKGLVIGSLAGWVNCRYSDYLDNKQ